MADLQYKGGTGLWTEWVDPDTGKSSLEEHELKTVWESCANNNHYFEVPSPTIREAVCAKCGFIKFFVLGFHSVKDGQIKSIH